MKAIKGTGKHIAYEDDIVVVYNPKGEEVFRGTEDYEPMKYEAWRFDEKKGYYRFGGYIKVVLR